uniref:Uncharacterized protein n=1 Tax=Timema tahoe TaxID=61484 RepID=A0A7R9ISQ2_9NEOP|nr:unnamed protein product [Timema tahoe]
MSDKLSITTKKIQLSDEHTLKWRKMRAVKKIKKISERKVTVIMGENELNGKRRFVADGFSQERECQVMLELSKIAAVEGDGYSGNISPHTSSERFEGVTLGRAALLYYIVLSNPGGERGEDGALLLKRKGKEWLGVNDVCLGDGEYNIGGVVGAALEAIRQASLSENEKDLVRGTSGGGEYATKHTTYKTYHATKRTTQVEGYLRRVF